MYILEIKNGMKNYWNDSQRVFSLKVAYIIALIVHLYGAVNLITNHDDVVIRYSNNYDQTYLGRWMFVLFSRLTGIVYQNNWTVAILSASLLAVTVVMTVDIYAIKSKTSICLLAGIMLAYPSVASWMLYTFNTLCFAFGVFSAVMAVKIITIFFEKKRGGWLYSIISAIFICMSIACYQAFLCITIAMLYTLIWKQGVQASTSNKRYVRNIFMSSVSIGNC